MLLPHRFTVYVPRPELVEGVARTLVERFGGATAIPARGYWVDSTGTLVEDPTTLVYSATHDPVTVEEAEALARSWAEAWGEEAVAVEVDGMMVLGFAATAGVV